MNTTISLIKPETFVVSRWSGGETTQIAIYPPKAQYPDRNFFWRISSATVKLPESDFTPLPDYDRYISPLEGHILLTHDAGIPVTLSPGEIHRFDGNVATKSRGTCVDFNLMLRKGRCDGTLECPRLPAAGEYPLTIPAEFGKASENRTAVLYCVQGGGVVCSKRRAMPFGQGQAVQIQAPVPGIALCVNESAVFMAAFMRCF